ncbi:hypothetical protein HB665_15335 [Bacillus paranthracis]|uniref:hypothetical protein n=1 Tax=Bacillus cereus group TaxID=86661 RepID=UPI00144466A7|nr:hypothetical protein [Bacillus paranthracis]NKX25539.1 hypothetical protein [Bacillus paranthracis]
MSKSNENTNIHFVMFFVIILISIVIGVFIFPAIKSSITEFQIEEETLAKGKLVNAKVIDKKFIDGDAGIPAMGVPGSPAKYLLTLYTNDQTQVLDVKSDFFKKIDVGDEIKAYEYKDHLSIEQDKRKSGWD